MTPLRLALADDQALVRRGLVAMLDADSRFEVVVEAQDGQDQNDHRPDDLGQTGCAGRDDLIDRVDVGEQDDEAENTIFHFRVSFVAFVGKETSQRGRKFPNGEGWLLPTNLKASHSTYIYGCFLAGNSHILGRFA